MSIGQYQEIALELVKLIQPQIQNACKDNCPNNTPEEFVEFVSKIYNGMLTEIQK